MPLLAYLQRIRRRGDAGLCRDGRARICFIGIYVALGWLLLPTFDIAIELETSHLHADHYIRADYPGLDLGLGAVQVVIIALYAPHVMSHIADPAAQVLAFSTMIGPATTVFRIASSATAFAVSDRQLVDQMP